MNIEFYKKSNEYYIRIDEEIFLFKDFIKNHKMSQVVFKSNGKSI